MTNTMPIKAKVMIGTVAVASLCSLAFGVTNHALPAWPQLALLMIAGIDLAAEGEAARYDEHDVWQFARHSSGSHAARIAR